MTMDASAATPAPSRAHASAPRRRLLLTLASGLAGGAVGGGLAILLGGCTSCAVGGNAPGIALMVGLPAAYGAWVGYSGR